MRGEKDWLIPHRRPRGGSPTEKEATLNLYYASFISASNHSFCHSGTTALVLPLTAAVGMDSHSGISSQKHKFEGVNIGFRSAYLSLGSIQVVFLLLWSMKYTFPS